MFSFHDFSQASCPNPKQKSHAAQQDRPISIPRHASARSWCKTARSITSQTFPFVPWAPRARRFRALCRRCPRMLGGMWFDAVGSGTGETGWNRVKAAEMGESYGLRWASGAEVVFSWDRLWNYCRWWQFGKEYDSDGSYTWIDLGESSINRCFPDPASNSFSENSGLGGSLQNKTVPQQILEVCFLFWCKIVFSKMGIR